MNEMVKNSVESRRTAIFSTYAITDENLFKKIEDYFNRLNDFASSYDDVMKFETDFAASPLSKEYTDLFMEISSSMNNSQGDNKDNIIADELKEDIKHEVRREVHREVYDKARDIPVVGEAMDLKNKFDLLRRFKKNKD